MNNNISVRDMQQAHDLYKIGKGLSAEEIDNVMKNKGHITSLKDLNFFGKIKRYFIEKRLRQNKLRKSDIRFLLRHVDGRATKGCLTPFVAYVANENLRDKFTDITLFEINKLHQTATIRFKKGGKDENIFYKKAGTKYEPDDDKTTQFNNSEEESAKLYEEFVQQQKTFKKQQRDDAAAKRKTLAEMPGSWEQQLINQQKIDETRADVRNQIINEQKIAATHQKDAENNYADLQRKVIENQNDETLSEIGKDSQELHEKIKKIREKNSTPSGSSDNVDSYFGKPNPNDRI